MGGTALKAKADTHTHTAAPHQHTQQTVPPGKASAGPRGAEGHYLPVETPDLPKLPWKLVDGVKEFHLVAEPVQVEIVPGRVMDVWGYNGSMPGPTIEAREGDRVRIIFENHLPEMTSVHWHGLEVPMEMDGVPGLGQDPIMPGGRFVYEFTLNQQGTFFYHSHFAMQEMMGMIGFFILHPKASHQPQVHRDFGLILQEWALLPNNTVPNSLAMEFNWLTINGKSGPATTPMLARPGERVRIRFVNLGMDHHPMHLHGHQFVVTGTEGGRIPETAWYPGNTVLVGVAQARDVEFEAKYVGDWMIHCHLPHHMMNQMVSMVGPLSHSGDTSDAGLGTEQSLEILRERGALDEKAAPGVQSLGLVPPRRRSVPVVAGQVRVPVEAEKKQSPPSHHHHGTPQSGDAMYPVDDPLKKQVPGYPQDMWMSMEHWVPESPEFYGLRPTWDRAMMGMMTLLRVLPPELWEKIQALKTTQPQETGSPKPKPIHQHKH
jgi:hypothetical protein